MGLYENYTLDQYQRQAQRTAPTSFKVENGALGLCGEEDIRKALVNLQNYFELGGEDE